MPSLSSDLRGKLEHVITEARDVAEVGARAALEALAVHHHEAYSHQTAEQRKLRNHLRAHARQLGYSQNTKGELRIDHLVHECAYEHWHRMLFARFLAENDLLIEPLSGMAISLQECEELAKEARTDLWTYASRCAQQMLPQIFRPDDPILQVTLTREHQLKLEKLLADLDPRVFKANDSLGWVYQFWQSKKKDEVNASGKKIGADELPAVTQLFTEDYMVDFLLDNSLGAWWVAKVAGLRDGKELRPGARGILRTAETEEEVRKFFALPGVPLEYLRFVKQEDGTWTPAAGTFDGWPEHLSELKTLDPCCGSGHFLVAGVLMLVAIRMALEGIEAREAVDRVLSENIHGLELDQRCVELAAFALAFTAWRYRDAGGYRQLPELNVACSGLVISARKEEWLALAGDNTNLRMALEELYKQFKDAPVLGSLINPEIGLAKGSLFELKWEEVGPLLTKALSGEKDDEKTEMGVVAQGLFKSADLLTNKYHLLPTNVPYLVFRRQSEILRTFNEKYYGDSENDLATVFISRCLKLASGVGVLAVVSPQNWLYQTRYKLFRKRLLDSGSLNLIARLGSGAFGTISGEVVKVSLSIINCSNNQPPIIVSNLDASDEQNAAGKSIALQHSDFMMISATEYLEVPDYRIISGIEGGMRLLSDHATILHGQNAGDNSLFNRCFWEVPRFEKTWRTYQLAPGEQAEFSGRSQIVRWEEENGTMARLAESVRHLNHKAQQWRSGKPNWGKKGVAVSLIGRIIGTLYDGDIYGVSCGVIIPKEEQDLGPIWEFVRSGEFETRLREVDPSLAVSVKTVLAVPFEQEAWADRYQKSYPNGLPKPYSDDPTQWIFHGHPAKGDESLQVAVAGLLGYRWPTELDSSMEVSDEARAWVKKSEALLPFADKDGIVCIPSVRGEEPAVDRLLALLGDCGIKPDHDLDDWLRDNFFEEHCKLFHYRPFIWHIWDGRRRDGFHALVNYHKLAERDGRGRKLLENLTYSYLGEWITRQQDGVKRGEDGAEDRLAAAIELQKRLIAILEGEPPHDLFVRWKPLHDQPIGWEPDINDGVRLNIRPFMASDLPNGRGGAGILRWKPNIKWDKDRGKEQQCPKTDFPWFWGWDGKTMDFMGGKEFTGERFNDCHYTVATKRKARELSEKSKDEGRR